MITDRLQSLAISNLGWVDRGSLWVLNTESDEISALTIGDGQWVRLHPGREDLFAAALFQPRRQPWMTVTIRDATRPSEILGRWEAGSGHADGTEKEWSLVPHVYVGFDAARDSYVTVFIDPTSRSVQIEPVERFDDNYDWGYQQPMTVTAVPESELLLYSVQRSSKLILYNPRTRRVERTIPLAGRHGNPDPVFRTAAAELWAADYDHLVRVSPVTWEVLDAERLQSTADGSRMFIGDFAFDSGEVRCVVARPFSGDVVVLDTASFRRIGEVSLGKQPLDVAMLEGGRVVARDWTTGELFSGSL